MSKQVIRGEKIKLSDIQCGYTFNIGIKCKFNETIPDISCFGVDASGKLSDDRYFIFYNQKSSPENAIVSLGGNNEYNEIFQVNLEKLPAGIVRLVFTATLDYDTVFSKLIEGKFDIIQSNNLLASYSFNGKDFLSEKAVIISEVYNKSVWRMSGVGQGFNGGLSALLKHFGGEEDPTPTPSPSPKPTPPPQATPPQAPIVSTPRAPTEQSSINMSRERTSRESTSGGNTSRVNISKVRLEKQGSVHKVNLEKGVEKYFHINFKWDSPEEKPKGFFGKLLGGSSGADLDLGCFWRDRDGSQGVIQPLGGNFGSKNSAPYIFLDKDDRSGSAADGENMHIFRPETLEKIVIFAFIYEGTAQFKDVNARLTIKDGDGGEIFIPLNDPRAHQRFCAVALITNTGNSLNFQKEERFFRDHAECDKHYDFGFRWVSGSK